MSERYDKAQVSKRKCGNNPFYILTHVKRDLLSAGAGRDSESETESLSRYIARKKETHFTAAACSPRCTLSMCREFKQSSYEVVVGEQRQERATGWKSQH